MEIRRAVSSDIPELQRLLLQVGGVHHDIRPDIFRRGCLKYTSEELAQLLADEERPVWAACEGNTMLGYCFCQWRSFRDSTAMTDRLELYIDDLCIDEESRGHGVAKALYDHVVAVAREQNCSFITLNVWCGNDRAMRFYEKMRLKPRSITMDMKLEESAC